MKTVVDQSFRFLSLWLLTAFFLPSPAAAGMIDKEGMKPWEICGLCHNLDGISHMAKFPKLAGQKKGYIEKQLKDFISETRMNGGGQMVAIVTEISEAEIPHIADYFSSLPPPAPVELHMEPARRDAAKKIFEQGIKQRQVPACKDCHTGSDPLNALVPKITAQHASYISKQLTDFKEQQRTNDPHMVMQNIAKKLSDEEIQMISEYVSSIPRSTEK